MQLWKIAFFILFVWICMGVSCGYSCTTVSPILAIPGERPFAEYGNCRSIHVVICCLLSANNCLYLMRFAGGQWIFDTLVIPANPHWFVHYLCMVLYKRRRSLVGQNVWFCMHRYQCNLTDLLACNLNSKITVGSNLSLKRMSCVKLVVLSDCIQHRDRLRRPDRTCGIGEIDLLIDLLCISWSFNSPDC